MKNIFKFMMLAAAALAFAACGEKDPTPEPEPEVELNQNLTFTLEVSSVEADKAKIKVTNNGTTADTWYGFVTSEVEKTEATLIKEEVDALLAEGNVTGLKKQTSTTVTLRSLEPETDYKYIVFGLAEDGTIYGTSESVTFTTAKGEVEFSVNSAWTVEYKGVGKIGETTYEHTVAVTSTDENLYFVTGVTKADYETKGIKAIAEEDLAYLKAYIDEFNKQNGTGYKLSDILFKGDGVDALTFEAGDWYAIAVGVDAEGEVSGLYAMSDVITIEEEEPTEEYAAWLGNWTLTGANGVVQNVTFHKGISNMSYYMTGYEGDDTAGLDIEVFWLAEDQVWVIYNQSFGTFNFGEQYGKGEVWFVGMTEEYNVYLNNEIPICVGGMTEDGTLAAYGYSETWENEDGSEGSYVVNHMAYIAYFSSAKQMSFLSATYETGFPSFPITITPAEEAATRSAAPAVKNVQKVTNLVKPYRTFGFVK